MSDFSANLKRLRKRAERSQDSLAEELQVSRQTVSGWERGRSYPDLDMLLRLCGALHATPDQLLYPPEKQTGFRPAGIVSAGLFQKIAAAVFVLGFVLGVSAGSEAYAPAPDTVGWHFVFRYAFPWWAGAFLSGMAFLGFSRILSLLSPDRETAPEEGT